MPRPYLTMAPPKDTAAAQKAKDAAHADWTKRTSEWEALAKASGIQMPPGAKVDPKDIRVEIGPPMTEEQFREWQERRKNLLKQFSQ